MKNLIFILAIGMVALAGCKKEDPIEVTSIEDMLTTEVSENSAYILNINDDNPVFELTEIPRFEPPHEESGDLNRSSTAHASGSFNGYGGSVNLTFTGIRYNRGGRLKGTAVFQQAMQLPFPPFFANVVIEMNLSCLDVSGNEAVYGGLMTSVTGSPFPPGAGPFVAGNSLYFRVKDNGDGVDQYSPSLVISPAFANSSCESYGLGAPFWAPVIDMTNESDHVTVLD